MTAPAGSPIRALILDMDGVLVDSGPLHAAAWRALFAPFGVEFDRAAYAQVGSGRSRDAVIRAVLGERPDHDVLMARKAELFLEALERDGVVRIDGVQGLLDRARQAGLAVAVATSSRLSAPVLARAGLAEAFDIVVDRNDVARGKPAPDLFQAAARCVGVDPSQALVVEDAPVGVQAALAAGCAVIGLAPDGGAAQLGAAHRVVASLDAIDPAVDPRV